MKKILPLIVLVLCLFAFACKKDKNSGTSASIVGKWTLASNIVTYYDASGKVVDTNNDGGGDNAITFNSDGTAIGVSPDGDVDHATYVITTSGGKKTIKIVTTYDDNSSDTEEYEIVTLTDHNLELQSTLTEDSPNSPYVKVVTDVKLTR